MNKEKTKVIRPFNMNPEDYARMFEAPPPDQLVMVIALMPLEGVDPRIPMNMFELINVIFCEDMDQTPEHPMNAKPRNAKEFTNFFVILNDLSIESDFDLPPDMMTWVVDGVYLQIGFVKADVNQCPTDVKELATAMLFYDRWVSESGSIEPGDHQDLSASVKIAERYEQTVGDLFQSGRGFLNRDLLEYRTMWLIGLRSMLTGHDTCRALDRLHEAGGTYFLDYPRLCAE